MHSFGGNQCDDVQKMIDETPRQTGTTKYLTLEMLVVLMLTFNTSLNMASALSVAVEFRNWPHGVVDEYKIT